MNKASISVLRGRSGKSGYNATKHGLIGRQQPSGQFVEAGHIADLLVFLCSPAAAEVRGVAWAMDGGTTAQ